jgi:cytochrome P450
VPLFFGKARRDFEFNGYRVPAGWSVLPLILQSAFSLGLDGWTTQP